MKNKILSVLFLITIFSIMLLGIIIPDKDISVSERRKLSKFPSLEIETIMNGEFFEDLNKYFIEHFPFRDFFRNIKGTISTNIFQKKDEDGIFIKDNGIYQLNTSLNEESVNHFTKILNKIQNRYLRTENIYYAIIPDKNYFLDDNIPKLDYQKLELLLNKNLNLFSEYIILAVDALWLSHAVFCFSLYTKYIYWLCFFHGFYPVCHK